MKTRAEREANYRKSEDALEAARVMLDNAQRAYAAAYRVNVEAWGQMIDPDPDPDYEEED